MHLRTTMTTSLELGKDLQEHPRQKARTRRHMTLRKDKPPKELDLLIESTHRTPPRDTRSGATICLISNHPSHATKAFQNSSLDITQPLSANSNRIFYGDLSECCH